MKTHFTQPRESPLELGAGLIPGNGAKNVCLPYVSLQETSLLHRVRATKAASMQLGEPSKLKRTDGVSLTSPRSFREGSLRDEEEGAAVANAHHLAAAAATTAMLDHTHTPSLSPSSIHTHIHTQAHKGEREDVGARALSL